MHVHTNPAILYFGTPVVLISTLNPDGTPNLAPMSSAWWLGDRCLLGLAASSRTTANLRRTGECVLNLPGAAQYEYVNRLALTTGTDPVPEAKQRRGYRFVADKFGLAGLTPLPSDLVAAPRAAQCPIHLEATLRAEHPVGEGGRLLALQVAVERVHVEQDLLAAPDRIDPAAWRPLIMSFQRLWGLAEEEVGPSVLASVPERLYR